ncbi:hypothetical protein CLOM_g182 [Closterium sp. NIES-68]|nr:hypothetical protein CLOM_g182 [Closterium sp. NIES-68]GJP68067.1 hypothetical protein CLOP_g24818 [Closterium sp. NIES-67]
MVQYGRYILSHRLPGWEPYYLNYKSLKKEIRAYEAAVAAGVTEELQQDMACRFSEHLDSQMEKVVLFFLQQQGVLAGKLQRLRELREGSNTRGDESSLAILMPTDFADMMEQYRDVGRELLQLLQFVELNATGLRKILKKFDRRVGVRLGQRYIASRTLHPYSHLQQIFRQVGLGAMVGTIIRNLDELHRRERCYASPSNLISPRGSLVSPRGSFRRTSFSLFRQGDESPVYVAQEEPIIQEIEAARAKLTDAVSYDTFVAKGLLLPPAPERGPEAAEPEFHWWSLQLNQFNTFLYMVNYYIIVPTSDEYAILLSAPPALCGIIIGATPLCALVSAFVFSKWSNTSYSQPLVISTLVLLLGNFTYATALDFRSVALLLIGRSLTGLGGVRAINRRYISDHVPSSQRTSASAGFVSAGALGMAAGPFAASLIDFLNFKFLGFTVNSVTSPGWLMVLMWLIYLACVVLFFKEPDRSHLQQPPPPLGKREKSAGELKRGKSAGELKREKSAGGFKRGKSAADLQSDASREALLGGCRGASCGGRDAGGDGNRRGDGDRDGVVVMDGVGGSVVTAASPADRSSGIENGEIGAVGGGVAGSTKWGGAWGAAAGVGAGAGERRGVVSSLIEPLLGRTAAAGAAGIAAAAARITGTVAAAEAGAAAAAGITGAVAAAEAGAAAAAGITGAVAAAEAGAAAKPPPVLLTALSNESDAQTWLHLASLPDIDDGEEEEEEDDDGASSTGAVETLPELMKELSRPISVLLFMYFMIKFATEVLISESSLVSKFYFQWTINDIGWFLGLLGLTVLPISSVVGNYITNIYEDRLVIMWTQLLIAVGVVAVMCFAPIIKYTTQQYIVAAVIIFVSCNVLEGVSLALMSRIMSPRLARGTFNCGLLSTEAGTFARVVGDGLITLVGYYGTHLVLNLTMIPVLISVLVSLVATRWVYYALY